MRRALLVVALCLAAAVDARAASVEGVRETPLPAGPIGSSSGGWTQAATPEAMLACANAPWSAADASGRRCYYTGGNVQADWNALDPGPAYLTAWSEETHAGSVAYTITMPVVPEGASYYLHFGHTNWELCGDEGLCAGGTGEPLNSSVLRIDASQVPCDVGNAGRQDLRIYGLVSHDQVVNKRRHRHIIYTADQGNDCDIEFVDSAWGANHGTITAGSVVFESFADLNPIFTNTWIKAEATGAGIPVVALELGRGLGVNSAGFVFKGGGMSGPVDRYWIVRKDDTEDGTHTNAHFLPHVGPFDATEQCPRFEYGLGFADLEPDSLGWYVHGGCMVVVTGTATCPFATSKTNAATSDHTWIAGLTVHLRGSVPAACFLDVLAGATDQGLLDITINQIDPVWSAFPIVRATPTSNATMTRFRVRHIGGTTYTCANAFSDEYDALLEAADTAIGTIVSNDTVLTFNYASGTDCRVMTIP